MATVGGPLNFDNDKVCVGIDGKKIDAALALIPFTELFCEDIEIVSNYFDLCAQESLNIRSLLQPGYAKSFFFDPAELLRCHFVYGHKQLFL